MYNIHNRGMVLATIILIAGLFICAAHPFYLSVLDLKYNKKEAAFQGSVRIFTSDLEAAIAKKEKKKVDLINYRDTVKTQQILNLYLRQFLSFEVNGKAVPISFIGFEKEEESTWIYLEFRATAPKKLKVNNQILCESIQSQSNIIHIECNSVKKSSKLDCPQSSVEFDF
jgi:hypothetical protein